MRLYLSSFDLGAQPQRLVALAGAARRANIIANALDHRPEARARWLAQQTEKLLALGFSVTELDLRQYFGASAALEAALKEFDLVWVNGGNAFILRRALRQSGADLILQRRLHCDEIVYAGFSAATVIAARSLRGLDLTDDPREVPAGYDAPIIWEGLGLLPFSLVVHVDSAHPESPAANQEIAYYELHGIPYRTLRDGEALVVDGGRIEIVGAAGDRHGDDDAHSASF